MAKRKTGKKQSNSNIVRFSREIFGEPYLKKYKKGHILEYCSKCKRSKISYAVFYPQSNKDNLICNKCFEEMYISAIKQKGEFVGFLPKGATIFVGKNAHNCRCKQRSFSDRMFFKLDNGSYNFTIVDLYECKICGSLVVNQEVFHRYKQCFSPYYNMIFTKTGNNIRKKTIETTSFLTRTTIKRCSAASHVIEDIQVAVRVLHKDYKVSLEKVPASYCMTCDKYYLLESDFQTLQRKGIILCNVVEESYWKSALKKGFFITNSESLLHKMGYNVSSNNNLYQSDRHAILRAAMDNGLLTRAEILSHLDYLITRSRNRANFSDAIEKWKSDRDYVQNYTSDGSNGTFTTKRIVHRVTKIQ